MTTFVTSSEFERDAVRVQRAADAGPVVVTEEGTPVYVLLRHDAYERLVGRRPSLRELLAQPGTEDFEFDPPKLQGPLHKPIDL